MRPSTPWPPGFYHNALRSTPGPRAWSARPAPQGEGLTQRKALTGDLCEMVQRRKYWDRAGKISRGTEWCRRLGDGAAHVAADGLSRQVDRALLHHRGRDDDGEQTSHRRKHQ